MKKSIIRLAGFMVVIGAVFLAFSFRLIYLQIVNGQELLQKSEKSVLRTAVIQAPRGEITDRIGRPLVSNRTGYSVTIEKDMISDDKLNSVLSKLIDLLDSNGDTYNDNFPISAEPFDFTSKDEKGNADLSKTFKTFLKNRKISSELSAPEIVDKLIVYYGLEQYDKTKARKIMSVRYELDIGNYAATGYVYAGDVSIASISKIKESYPDYPGISIETIPFREYAVNNLASHILGRVGSIFAEEYATLKAKGYSLNDQVGKDGIEKTCEEYLKGKNGIRQVTKNTDGQVTSIIDTVSAVPGNNVMLTIDEDLQRVAENSLASVISSIKITQKDGLGGDAQGGAVVALDVNSGEVLVLANYPTYNLEDYNKNFSSLVNDSLKPLLNRAISGTYPPGSSFKMLTGIAGLEEGVITTGTTFTCIGKYTYYDDYQPTCYRGMVHGTQALDGALRWSCNCYFFDVARKLGITKLNKWEQLFGFAELTGIELPGEAKGVAANPEYSEKVLNRTWTAGMTIQAGIGQSDDMFTPIQLAGYVQTLATGGIRYKEHIVRAVKSYHYDQTILENKPVVAQTVPLSDTTKAAIKLGMSRVVEEGSIRKYFSGLNVSVAGKTGTAQVPGGSPNGVFVCYAPIENPQIAIAVVVEHGAEGGLVSPVAAAIIQEYFKAKETGDTVAYDGVLLN